MESVVSVVPRSSDNLLRVVGRLCLLGWADRCLGGGLVGRALPLHLRDLRLRLGLPFLEVDAPVIAAPSSPLGWWALVYRRALFVGRRRASLVFANYRDIDLRNTPGSRPNAARKGRRASKGAG